MKKYNYWDICRFMEKTNYIKLKIKETNKKKNRKIIDNEYINNEYLDNLKKLSCLLQI